MASSYVHTAEEAVAKLDGEFEIVRTDPRTLLIDLDDRASLETYQNQLKILQQYMAAVEIGSWRSKSDNWHKVVKVDRDLSIEERLGLQAMLGSDVKRELLGFLDVNNRGDSDDRIVLFKPLEHECPF